MQPAVAITPLLHKADPSNPDSASELLSAVYEELRQMAARIFRTERRGHTLQPTDVVHEACIRLVKIPGRHWKNRAHFFSVAARIMRRILVDYARSRGADKRGGKLQRVELTHKLAERYGLPSDDLSIFPAVDNALMRLKKFAPRQALIIERRFFAGLSIKETAESLGLSRTTVKDEWTVARAWLLRELKTTA